jgi:hypothetical protein
LPMALRRARIRLVAASMEWWISSSRFGVKRFGSIQRLATNFGSRVLVLTSRDCHQHCKGGSGKGATTAAVAARSVVVVVRWFKDVDLISIMFWTICNPCEVMK